MTTVNIPSYHEDPNYRYKMPRIRAKIEGRGNGIKTNIMNMGDIARALKRPPEYPTRFCGCELGSQSKFEIAEGKAIVNGVHTEADLQIILDKFVDKFVLCPSCRLPEVDLHVTKGRVRGKCNACGFAGDMDNAHKVGTYIIKNPPDGGDSTVGKKIKKSKEERQRERAERGHKKSSEEDEDSADRDHVGTSATTTAEAAAAPVKEKKEKKEKKDKKDKDKDGHKKDKKPSKKDKEKDEDKERRKAEKKAAKKAAAAAVDSDSDEDEDKKEHLDFDSEEIEAVISRLEQFVHNHGEPPTSQSFFQEVRLLQVAQDFSATLRAYVSLCALLLPGCDPDTLRANMHYIQAVCDRSVTGDQILEAFEEMLERKARSSWSHYAVMCSVLYNADLVEEDTFLDRYERSKPEGAGSAHQEAKQNAASFLQWLKEAESASDGSDADEDDD